MKLIPIDSKKGGGLTLSKIAHDSMNNPPIASNEYNTPITDMPTFDKVRTTFIPIDFELTDTGKGSANKVYTYTGPNNSKLSLRIAIDATYTIYNPGESADEKLNERDISEMKQSKYNWINASNNNLSPMLFYYGYVKEENSEGTSVYLCMISQGYDMDLYTYYNAILSEYDNKSSLTGNDKYIASQLIDLLNQSHKLLGIICFDIKPQNCVINKDTLEVRLIDWDGDWCQDFSTLLKNRDNVENISIISDIVMANHFYYSIDRNIFADYFNNNLDNIYGRDVLVEKYKALEHLFCDIPNVQYSFFADHYFRFKYKQPPIIECKDKFLKMVERSKLINRSQSITGGKRKRNAKRKNTKRKNTKRKKTKKVKSIRKHKGSRRKSNHNKK